MQQEGIKLMRELGKKFKEEFVTTEEDMVYFFGLYCKLHKEKMNPKWRRDIEKTEGWKWTLDKQDNDIINNFIDNFCNDIQTDLGHHYTLYAYFLQGITGLEI